MKSPITIDFETEPIEPRPHYPPKPVGVAVRVPGERLRYYAWGHPSGNNCTMDGARILLESIWDSDRSILMHNAAFDLEVARVYMHLPLPPWQRIEDTLYLAFLHDPNAQQLGLKILAERLLGQPPDEASAVRDWVFEHVKGARRSPTKWGRRIALAPGDLVAKYAVGDVTRTYDLWRYYHKAGIQQEPYDRERRLLPVLLQMERIGVPVDGPGLRDDQVAAVGALQRLDRYLVRRLGRKGVNLDSRDELADAMEAADLVEEWVETDSGQRSTAIPALKEVGVEPRFVAALELRSLIRIQLQTFIRPWLAMADEFPGGRIYCQWNPVRSASTHDARQIGARTGRLSSSPNFQNVPVREREISSPVGNTGPLDLRSRIAAPRGYRLICGDQAQQELRVLAHFAGGPLAQSYRSNPKFDLHAQVQAGAPVPLPERWQAKILFFRRIYGSGIQGIADSIGISYEEARLLKRAMGQLVPGMQELDDKLQKAQGCTTWGGRYCPVEPAREINDRWADWSYKLLNTLIQGSSADLIKECMIRYYEHPDRDGELLLSVHDELVVLARTRVARRQRKVLLECMEGVELDVPMLAEAGIGRTWRGAK